MKPFINMELMMAKYFRKKLDESLSIDPLVNHIDSLLSESVRIGAFVSSDELADYLMEGAILNVNRLGSQAFSIPSGQYLVWTTDGGTTMLVPSDDFGLRNDVHESFSDSVEIYTNDLLRSYNGFNKPLNESLFEADDEESAEEAKDDDDDFELAVDKTTVDRTNILQAMEDQNMTETELAELVGVDVPAISRILRKKKQGPGDPGGRDPSIKTAAKICKILNIDPSQAFPDIFSSKK